MDQIGRKARVRRLQADLELVIRTINSLDEELEEINSIEADKRANELGKQAKELV